jgi:hypothetical protein
LSLAGIAVTICLMRRHERKRGTKVTGDADPEGYSPEITALDMADSLDLLAGNSCHSV